MNVQCSVKHLIPASLFAIGGRLQEKSAQLVRQFASPILLVAALAAMMAATAHAQSSFTWSGGGTDGNWTTGGNWSGGSAPGSPQNILNFAGSTRTTSTNNFSNYSAGYQMFFNTGAAAFTLGGDAINFYNFGSTVATNSPGVENDSSSTQTVNLQVDMEANANASAWDFNVTAISGNVNLGTSSGNAFNYYSDVTNDWLALHADNGNTITVYGKINNGGGGTAKVFMDGGGTVVYAGANAYTGETDINAGTLQINSGGSISSSSAIYLGNGTLASSTAELALAGAGQTFSNNFTINTGADNTKRIVAGLNTSGTSTYSGTVTVGSDFQVNAAFGGTVAITGQLTGGATGYGLVKTGLGTVILENSSDNYTGTNNGALSGVGTQIYGGTLGIYASTCLGLAPAAAYNDISFYGNGALQDTSSYITLGSNRNIFINTGVTGTLDNGGNSFGVAGVISGGGSLTTIGAGTLALSGNNSYSGGTAVSAGSLIVTGSLSGTVSTAITSATLEVDGLVNTSATNTLTGAGATLQGTGKVGAIVANGGNIDPGYTAADAGSSTGFLTASGAVTLSSTSNFDIRIGLGASGTDSDELVENGSGAVFLSGTLNLSLGSGMGNLATANVDHLYYVIVNGGSAAVTGTFTGLLNHATVSVSGYSFEIYYNTDAVGNSDSGTGNDVVLELTGAIPEPAACAMLFSGFGVLFGLQKMRKNRVGTGWRRIS